MAETNVLLVGIFFVTLIQWYSIVQIYRSVLDLNHKIEEIREDHEVTVYAPWN